MKGQGRAGQGRVEGGWARAKGERGGGGQGRFNSLHPRSLHCDE